MKSNRFFSIVCLFALVLSLAGCLSGCSSLRNAPPGACSYWEHIGNYGPFLQTHVVAHGVVKNADGTFTVSDYTGGVNVLGYGMHDVVQGLVIQAPAAVTK